MSIIVLSGCTLTAGAVSDVQSIDVVEKSTPAKSSWSMKKGLASNKKDDCLDCYVTVPGKSGDKIERNKPSKPVYSYDYSNMPADIYDNKVEEKTFVNNNAYPSNRVEDPYAQRYTIQNSALARPTIESFSNKTAIQVGAFRKYAGAKVYAKKYNLLTDKYNVEIKKNVKDNRPLYRVRIEGFSSRSEAKEFISKYGITEAFLVRN